MTSRSVSLDEALRETGEIGGKPTGPTKQYPLL